MKKLLLSTAALLAFGFANAQTEKGDNTNLTSKKGENYLPQTDDWAISFNADGAFKYIGNAFNGNIDNAAPSFSSPISNTIVGKLFISEKQAYRAVANLGFGSKTTTTTTEIVGAPQGTMSELKVNNSSFDLKLGVGKEWRKGSTRLQGFYGADALIGFGSSSKTTTKNIPAYNAVPANTTEKKIEDGTTIGLGVQGFLGAEYFLFPKMAIGVQYTYGIGIESNGKSKTTESATGADTKTVEGPSSFAFKLGNVGVTSVNLTLHF